MNNRGELDVITTADGTRKQVIVSAPGCIDAITFTAEAGAGQPVPARTE